jgi:hypothetical protein
MGYASRSGRARVSVSNPQAFGVCDRCGIWYNFADLGWQYDWRGASLQNTYLKVCNRCRDTPQEQLRAFAVPADPLPVMQARTEPFAVDEVGGISTTVTGTDPTTGLPIYGVNPVPTGQQVGKPEGLTQAAVQPLQVVNGIPTKFGQPLALLSVIGGPGSLVTVTCSVAHGLITNSQVSAQGLASAVANGFFSVTFISATAFSYATFSAPTAGSLLQPSARIVPVLVGLPYATPTIPVLG